MTISHSLIAMINTRSSFAPCSIVATKFFSLHHTITELATDSVNFTFECKTMVLRTFQGKIYLVINFFNDKTHTKFWLPER